MAGWVRFPLDAGAVNSRPANALAQGEFAESSGVAYKPSSEQLYPDIAYSSFGTPPLNTSLSGFKGPFYLSFESTNDWIMLIGVLQGRFGPAGGTIYFRRADGQGSWVEDETLADNIGNGTALTAASVVHWGDRYYLATDHGCREIAPPTGTGPPTVERLGLITWETRLGILGDNAAFIATFASDCVASTGRTTVSDFKDGDYASVFLTEYDSVNDVESLPLWIGGDTGETSVQFDADGGWFQVTTPIAFLNGQSTNFRLYVKYWGTSEAEDRSSEQSFLDRGAVTGLSFYGTYDLGETVDIDTISKAAINNPLPVLAVDTARLIFPAQRHPSCATAAAVWNDSFVCNDSGFSLDPKNDGNVPIWDYRDEAAVSTIVRYSAPQDLRNQPVPYFLNFASEREDDIRALKVVNDRLVVLCDQAVHSVRYLPFNNLLSSQQGRVKDVVTTNVGLASPDAAVKIETAQGEMCVWLSRRGLEWTDGTGWDDACPDFTPPEGASVESAVMVNLPSEYRVDLYLDTDLYSFYYHPSHMKGNRLKMLGPTAVGTRIFGACEYGGTVYRMTANGYEVEWSTDSIPAPAGYVYTGHVSGKNPFVDIVVQDIGVTHDGFDGSITVRCDAATVGKAIENGNSVEIQNVHLDETGYASLAQRGNYVRIRMDIAPNYPDRYSVGPMWLNGGEESGGNG
jgi:hypothetical protein